MDIYIIATIRSGINNKMNGFVLLDIDDNNKTLTVTKEQLINVLRQKKLKLNNAKLSGNTIQGTYYSLEKLPYNINQQNKYQVLYTDSYGKAKVVHLDNSGVHVLDLCNNEVINLLRGGYILNIDSNSNILCKRINLQSNNSNIHNNLDKEALDENVEWSLERFRDYMKLKGWSYELKKDKNDISDGYYVLSNIHPYCDIIHVPVGVTEVENLYSDIPQKHIKKVIFSNTVVNVRRFIPDYIEHDNYISVGDIIFQKCNKISRKVNNVDMIGLRKLNITGKITLPSSCMNSIESIYEDCIIHNNLEVDSNYNIKYSFRNSKFKQNKLRVNCKSLDSSFSEVENVKEVYIDNNITNISSSFNNAKIECINFERAINLCNISNSFKELNITVVDMSRCERLIRLMGNTFFNCNLLRNIVLPDTVRSIACNVANGTLINHVKLPRDLEQLIFDAFNRDTEYLMDKGIKELSQNLLMRYEGQIIKSEGYELKTIKSQAFISASSYEYEINLPSSICNIEERGFEKSNITIFDSAKFPNLHEIPSKCFLNCQKLNIVILDNNIQSIKGQSFRNCNNIDIIILGNNVIELSASAFSNMQSVKNPICYAIKGSKAYKEMKKLGIAIIEVNSVDEARDIVFNSRKTAEDKIAKYEIFLDGTIHSKLLEEPYIKDIGFSYKFINDMYNCEKPANSNLVLDTSKYTDININYFPIFKNYIESKEVAINSSCSTADDKFIAISNLFTCLYTMNPILNGIDTLHKILENSNITILSNCYSSEDRHIIACKFSGIQDNVFTSLDNTMTIYLLIILEANSIKFIAPFNMEYYKYASKITEGCLAYNKNIEDYFNIGKYLNTGDILSFDKISINNALIHPDYINTIMTSISNNFVTLGSRCINKSKKTYKALLYDLYSQNLFVVNCGTKVNKAMQDTIMSDIKSITIVSKHKFSEIKQLPCIEIMINAGETVEIKQALNNLMLDNKEKQAIIDNINNYDIDGDKQLKELSELIFNNGINDFSKLSFNLMSLMFNTDFFEDTDLTLNNVNNDTNYQFKAIKQFEGTQTVLIIYKDKENNNYLSALASPSTPMNKSGFIKRSFFGPEAIMQALYIMGNSIVNSMEQPYCKISNNKINIDNFLCLRTIHSKYFSLNGIKLHLALDKLNCDSYIIGEYLDTDFYALLRFKKLSYCNKYFESLTSTLSSELESCTNLMYKLMRPNSSDSKNTVIKVREEIMAGVPNNYSFHSQNNKLFNVLAKQPKI